ncbi:MAG: hypothetical protein IIC49_02860, partial [Planctomycetes bacterium]|nr:hypothetical protein [Planctomycetota bacterium]
MMIGALVAAGAVIATAVSVGGWGDKPEPANVGVTGLVQPEGFEMPPEMAAWVEEGEPEFRNTLINAVDFEENLRTGELPGTSPDLMRQEIDLASKAVLKFDGGKALRPPTLKKEGYAFLSAGGLAALLAIILSDPLFTILPR